MASKKRKASKPKSAPKRDTKAKRGTLAALLYWGMVAGVWLVIAIFGVVVWYSKDLPDVRQQGLAGGRPSVTLLAKDRSELFRFGDLYGEALRPDELPASLPHAVIATEDRRFYSHFGIDLLGLARAVTVNLGAGRIVQGGSTISQQLAKNLFLTPERTLKRKIQEVLLAFWLEWRFSKDEILGLYLNRVYFGAGTYGVEAASRKYFGVSPRRVGVLESAAEADAAKQAKLRARSRRRISGARYFADWILEQVPDYVGHSDADLVVVTTLVMVFIMTVLGKVNPRR